VERPPSRGVGTGIPSDAGQAPPPSPPFRRILLALEPGPNAARLRRVAVGLVLGFRCEVVVCHVVMRATSVAGNELDGSPANPEEVALLAALRSELVQDFGEPGHRVPIKVLHGDPGQRICEYADYLDADLIVLGSRRRTISQRLRGSVSKYVAGASRRSVLVVGE
jgi:nucleotide-binding universal stress UspA family protein